MGVNLDKPHLWKPDIAQSVDLYNDWFLRFAPFETHAGGGDVSGVATG